MSDIKLQINGVVLPHWLAICLLATAVLSAVALLLNYRQQTVVEREIRVLQLHCADIENVLIRQKVATRQDFARWREEEKK